MFSRGTENMHWREIIETFHYVKNVYIWSFSGPYFPAIWTEYGEMRSIFPYLVRMRENTDQKNFEHGHFYVVFISYSGY